MRKIKAAMLLCINSHRLTRCTCAAFPQLILESPAPILLSVKASRKLAPTVLSAQSRLRSFMTVFPRVLIRPPVQETLASNEGNGVWYTKPFVHPVYINHLFILYVVADPDYRSQLLD